LSPAAESRIDGAPHKKDRRMRRTALLAAAIAVAAPLAPVTAQVADQDLRCLLAANVFARAEKDAKRKQVAVVATFFYLGRIDGRLTPAQLKARMLAVGKTLNTKNAGEIMTGCARTLQQRELAFQGIGKELAAQAPK
jgi:hypothetical protein